MRMKDQPSQGTKVVYNYFFILNVYINYNKNNYLSIVKIYLGLAASFPP